jgi:hypothetical protein
MEKAMQIEALEPKRTPEGAIDIRHHARAGLAARQVAKNNAMRTIGRGTKRAVLAVFAIVAFWNIPALGSSSSKDMPYR